MPMLTIREIESDSDKTALAALSEANATVLGLDVLNCVVRGIWDKSVPVGLVALVNGVAEGSEAYGLPGTENAAYLLHLMIDEKFRRRGFGGQAMLWVANTAHEWGKDRICTHVGNGDAGVRKFFENWKLEVLPGAADETNGKVFMITPKIRFVIHEG